MPDEAIMTRPKALTRAAAGFSVEVFTDFAPALDAWTQLEECAPAPLYQTRRFVVPWFATMSKHAGLTPMIVLLRDTSGELAALWPLGVRQSKGIRRVEFLGGKDSNSNMGLMRPDVHLPAPHIQKILLEAARLSGLSPDIYILANQPAQWEGFANNLVKLPSQPSPSACHSAQLMADSEAFHNRQLSSDARKKLRAKRRKLEEMGPVSLLTARTEDEARRILEAFFLQKLQRFDEKNIKSGFDSPAARSFFERCCLSRIGRRDAAVELHGLLIGDRIVATYGGGVHRGRFHGMFNSFDPEPAIARQSPGDVLLNLLTESKCRQGLQTFDLGIGEGRYKSTWCDQVEPLFDTLIPITVKGRVFAMAEFLRRKAKRAIKQNPRAWAFAQKVRQGMRRFS